MAHWHTCSRHIRYIYKFRAKGRMLHTIVNIDLHIRVLIHCYSELRTHFLINLNEKVSPNFSLVLYISR